MSFASGFELVLHRVEKDAEVVFKDVFKVAVGSEPVVDLALAASGNTALIGLYNQTVTLVGIAQQAAITAGAQKAGTAKAAAVAGAIAPSVAAIEKQFGIKVDIEPWVQAAFLGMKAISGAVAATPTA